MGLLGLGPWYEARVVGGSCSVNTLLSFGDLIENFFCSNQSHFPDLGICGIDQVRLILLYEFYNFQLYSSSDKIDNHATVISHTEFGLLGQLV